MARLDACKRMVRRRRRRYCRRARAKAPRKRKKKAAAAEQSLLLLLLLPLLLLSPSLGKSSTPHAPPSTAYLHGIRTRMELSISSLDVTMARLKSSTLMHWTRDAVVQKILLPLMKVHLVEGAEESKTKNFQLN